MKKSLLYEMKFLVPNYSCLQNHWGATAPRSPFSLFSLLNWICWTPLPSPEQNSWVRHCLHLTWKLHGSVIEGARRTAFNSTVTFFMMLLTSWNYLPLRAVLTSWNRTCRVGRGPVNEVASWSPSRDSAGSDSLSWNDRTFRFPVNVQLIH
jgi:hypothetical protein